MSAKVDPLRVISSQLLRPEIVIVLDTSGSMTVPPGEAVAWSNLAGGDCGGPRTGSVDICGDGLCSGLESTGNCGADCTFSGTASATPGGAAVCVNGADPDSRRITGMFIIKRVLRQLLPELRAAASFGLVTFGQQADAAGNYFQYYRALPVTSGTKQVSIYLPQLRLNHLGGWINKAPAPVFVGDDGVTSYTLLSGTALAGGDSLYSRVDDSSIETRFDFSTAGRRYSSGGFEWQYRGSYYVYTQRATDTSFRIIRGTYRGPQYYDAGTNTTYVYRKFTHRAWGGQGIVASNTGQRAVSLAQIDEVVMTKAQVESATASSLNDILIKMGDAANGGIHTIGGTPTGPAIITGTNHFLARQNGTAPFTVSDASSACRPRFLLVLTDGLSSWGTANPETAARDLYSHGSFSGNEIKTLVVGLPGLPDNARAELNRIADAGDDGAMNSSATAYFAGNEAELVKTIKKALFEKILGDYTMTAPSVATSQGSSVEGNISLIPSTEFPGWKGHLRAIDLAHSPPQDLWDAGQRLQAADWRGRTLYTGLSGAPILMMKPDGTGNVTDAAASQIQSIWPGTAPSIANVKAFIQYLAGKGVDWRLGALVRSVPAVIGPPPHISTQVPSHAGFEAAYGNRQRLVYVASAGTGLMHAFDLETGSEAFAFLPPAVLEKSYQVYKEDGQDEDPGEFSWMLASSPRVEDIQTSAGTWVTQLVLTTGPGGEDFSVLDISNPSTCTGNPCTYTTRSPPFSIIGTQSAMAPSVGHRFGETWSIPALFYDSSAMGHAALASGYAQTAGSQEGRYYNYFSDLSNWSSASGAFYSYLRDYPLSPLPALKGADYAVLADTAAAVDLADGMNMGVVATYQADLYGRITRFHKGKTIGTPAPTVVLQSSGADAGKHPFHHAPAVLNRNGVGVTFAAVSGAFEEEHAWMRDNAFVSRLYMRSEDGGTVLPRDSVTCPINSVCTTCFAGPAPAGCSSAPSARALPSSRPILVENSKTNNVEAFYLYYDPPTQRCHGNSITVGDSYLLRVGTDIATGLKQSLVDIKRFPKKVVTGMAIVGGGTDIALSVAGKGGGGVRASAESLSQQPVRGGGTTGGALLEGILEVH